MFLKDEVPFMVIFSTKQLLVPGYRMFAEVVLNAPYRMPSNLFQNFVYTVCYSAINNQSNLKVTSPPTDIPRLLFLAA